MLGKFIQSPRVEYSYTSRCGINVDEHTLDITGRNGYSVRCPIFDIYLIKPVVLHFGFIYSDVEGTQRLKDRADHRSEQVVRMQPAYSVFRHM